MTTQPGEVPRAQARGPSRRNMNTNAQTTAQVIQLAPARRVRPALAAIITGLTAKAIERKIQAGKWLEGREYFRDPDGQVWVDIEGVMKWAEKGRA